MRTMLVFALMLVSLISSAQPFTRNFFTTNPAPVVQVTAGTNVNITFSAAGSTRTYRVDVPALGGVSNIYVASGTGIQITTNGSIYTFAISNPLPVITLNAGTLVVTNPPALNLSASTNMPAASMTGTVTNPISSVTANVGTLVVTNPPVLDLGASTNFWYFTNSTSTTPNMMLPESDFQTNAAFAWAGYSGLSTSNTYQHKLVHVWAAGSAILMSFPANTFVQGTAYATNLTDVLFDFTPGRQTNALCLPRR